MPPARRAHGGRSPPERSELASLTIFDESLVHSIQYITLRRSRGSDGSSWPKALARSDSKRQFQQRGPTGLDCGDGSTVSTRITNIKNIIQIHASHPRFDARRFSTKIRPKNQDDIRLNYVFKSTQVTLHLMLGVFSPKYVQKIRRYLTKIRFGLPPQNLSVRSTVPTCTPT